MDSKAHLLLFLSTLLLHTHLTTATCVKREYLHAIHSLLATPPTSSPSSPAPQQSSTAQSVSQLNIPDGGSSFPPQPASDPSAAGLLQSMVAKTADSPIDSLGHEVKDTAEALSAAAQAAVKDVCSKTDYPDVCISSLTSMPIDTDTLGPDVALQMLIKSAVRHGNAALVEATKLASDTSLPAFTSQNMKVCQETYTSALDNFQNAADAATAKDMGKLNSMLSAAMTDYETCSDGFMEMPGASPLLDIDTKLTQMTSNCLAVAGLMK